MQPILRHVEDFSWIFAIILLIGISLVFVKFAFIKFFYALGNLTIFKETDQNAISLALIINIMIGCLIGIIVIPYIHIPHLISPSSWVTVTFITLISIIFILLKFVINTIITFIGSAKKDFINIVKGKIYFRIFWVVYLMICALLLYYSTLPEVYILYAFLFSLGVIILLEYYQTLNQGNMYRYINSYYFILYLCILEIFPVLYIYNHWYG